MAALCMVFSASTVRAGDVDKPKLKTPQEIFESVDRSIRIAPVKLSDGIMTGVVIIYGHVVPPPYKVEYRGDSLYMNGVQVSPALVARREYEKSYRKPTEADRVKSRGITEFTSRAQDIYRKKKVKVSDAALKSEILDYVKSQKLVKDAKWDSERFMLVKLADDKWDSFGYGIEFNLIEPGSRIEPESVRKVRIESNKKQHLEEIGNRLRKGDCAFFTSDDGVYFSPDPREKVNAIMQDSKLSKRERIHRLHEEVLPGTSFPALDIVANYDPDEWKVGKEPK